MTSIWTVSRIVRSSRCRRNEFAYKAGLEWDCAFLAANSFHEKAGNSQGGFVFT